MKQTLHKRLHKLEQAVEARRASERPASTGHLEIIRGWLRAWALGIRPAELRDRLRRLACAQ